MINKKYELLLQRDNTDVDDLERKSLLYILASNEDIYKNKESVYNFESHYINPDSISSAWITGGTRSLLLLAFNLYNGFIELDEDDNLTSNYSTIVDVFNNLDSKNFEIAMNAIKIRFNKM